MKYLFIGGPADGEWMEVPDARSIVRIGDSPGLNPEKGTPRDSTIHSYCCEQFQLDGALHYYMYRHESLSLGQMFDRLLAGYDPKTAKLQDIGRPLVNKTSKEAPQCCAGIRAGEHNRCRNKATWKSLSPGEPMYWCDEHKMHQCEPLVNETPERRPRERPKLDIKYRCDAAGCNEPAVCKFDMPNFEKTGIETTFYWCENHKKDYATPLVTEKPADMDLPPL